MIINADKNTFDTLIQKPCIVDFYTSFCPSCEKFGPVFEQASAHHSGYDFLKVNLDDDITLAQRYDITYVPTIIKFIDGVPVSTHTGYMSYEDFSRFIGAEGMTEK